MLVIVALTGLWHQDMRDGLATVVEFFWHW
jgi:hypothetical protein